MRRLMVDIRDVTGRPVEQVRVLVGVPETRVGDGHVIHGFMREVELVDGRGHVQVETGMLQVQISTPSSDEWRTVFVPDGEEPVELVGLMAAGAVASEPNALEVVVRTASKASEAATAARQASEEVTRQVGVVREQAERVAGIASTVEGKVAGVELAVGQANGAARRAEGKAEEVERFAGEVASGVVAVKNHAEQISAAVETVEGKLNQATSVVASANEGASRLEVVAASVDEKVQRFDFAVGQAEASAASAVSNSQKSGQDAAAAAQSAIQARQYAETAKHEADRATGAEGGISEEQVRRLIQTALAQQPPSTTADTREAWQKWVDPTKRHYAPVTYWWADQQQSTSNWHHVLQNMDAVPFVIINPASGPGSKQEPDFVDLTNKLRDIGRAFVGYVRTTQSWEPNRQTRDKQAILGEIAQYVQYYGVSGVFLDEMINGWSPEQTNLIPFYRDLYQEIKRLYGKHFLVVGNPGTNTKEELLECADILMTFESSAAEYLQRDMNNILPWHYKKYARCRFVHVVHDVQSQDQARQVLSRMGQAHVGSVYLTTDTFSGVLGSEGPSNNPWDNLPQQWLIDMQLRWARNQQV